jgi:predicted CXXCH cytochrome family protein
MTMSAQGPLCGACHDEIEKSAKGARSRHKPVVASECTQCHNPHKAKLPFLLVAKSPELCLTCHKDLKARMAKDNVHQPAARDCLRCHKPHASAEDALLIKGIPATCLECHNAQRASFSKAHLRIDPAVMDCRSCHDPHASKDPKLFKADIHMPFGARACDECHLP